MFLLCLVLRLLFLAAMLWQVGAAPLLTMSPDTVDYVGAADAIRGGWDYDTKGTLIFGPGYPMFLALMQILTGGSGLALLLVNIVLNAMGSVLLYVWAHKLVHDQRIAIAAALLNACSLTSISLANILLSETLFVFLLLLGLIAFLKANESGRVLMYVLSGLVMAAAVLVRSMGQFLVVLLPVIAWLVNSGTRPTYKRISWSLLSCVVMIVPVVLWSQQYHRNHGVFSPSLAGSGGIAQLVRSVYSATEGVSFVQSREWFDSAVVARQNETHDLFGSFNDVAWQKLRQFLADCPGTVAKEYLKMIDGNIHNEFSMFGAQLPRWSKAYDTMRIFNSKKGLNYRVSLLALIGAWMLIRKRAYRTLTVLLLLYLYFAAVAGFSMWQTSRIFYPGQIAWTVLAAFPLVAMYEWVKAWVSQRLSRRSPREL